MLGRIIVSGAAASRAECGGKAEGLRLLAEAGLSVPPWFCVAASAFRKVAGSAIDFYQAGLWRIDDDGALREFCRESADRARQAIQTDLARGERGLLGRVAEECRRRFPASRLAFRSSALEEDGATASFAGQFESILDVEAAASSDALARCWLSYFEPALALYRRRRAGGGSARGMAVVVQAMVEPAFSGVAFSVDPRGDLGSVSVNAVAGRGEALMQGEAEAERWSVDRRTLVAHRISAAGGPRSGMTSGEAAELARQCLKAEEAIGGWADFEWAFDGEFRALQARPVTALPPGPPRLLDNGNIVESYPGISSPLTFSFARRAYSSIFGNLARRVGIQAARADRDGPGDMIARFMGRIYYDLGNWYGLYSLLPFASRFVPLWERMMGIPRGFSRPASRPSLAHRLATSARGFRVAIRAVSELARLGSSMPALLARFDALEAEFENKFEKGMARGEMPGLYRELCERMLAGWELTLLNDGFAFIGTALAQKTIRAIRRGGDPTAAFNGLMCGYEGVESLEPARLALRLGEILSCSPSLIAQAIAAPAARVRRLESVSGDPAEREAAASFNAALAAYLSRFGARSAEELKLETPSYAEAPWILIARSGGYAAAGLRAADMESRERAVRQAAEAGLFAGWRAALLRPQLNFFLSMAGKAIAYREASRLRRCRFFRLVRKFFLAAGELLAAQGALASADEIFWLEESEVLAALASASPDPALAALAAKRKAETEGFRGLEAPERIMWKGDLGDAERAMAERARGTEAEAGAEAGERVTVRGIGCSPGRARARALVVTDPDAASGASGKILIARSTDPGWVFLMVEAAGLIVEKGSVLSHTAIIGRELGVPTIVGAAGAMKAFSSGDLVEMDAGSGEAFRVDAGS